MAAHLLAAMARRCPAPAVMSHGATDASTQYYLHRCGRFHRPKCIMMACMLVSYRPLAHLKRGSPGSRAPQVFSSVLHTVIMGTTSPRTPRTHCEKSFFT